MRQAFGSTYSDKTTGEDRSIYRVIVTSTGSIKEPSQKAIRTQLDPNQRRHVRFWDGEKIADLITEYLPQRSMPQKLADVRQTLRGLESFSVTSQVRQDGVTHWITAKAKNVVFAKAEFVFPDTPKDSQARDDFQSFLDEGGRVTIPGEYIESFDQHDELARIFGAGKPGSIRLESREGNARPVRLAVDSTSGPISYEGLALRLAKSGQRRSEFRTVRENDPLFVMIVLGRDSERMRISLTLGLQPLGHEAQRVRHALRIWEALASGASLTLLDVKMNSPLIPLATMPELVLPPSGFRQYVENLAYIEHRLGWELAIPEDISERDLLDAVELRQILESGLIISPFGSVSFKIAPYAGVNLPSVLKPGEVRSVKSEMVGAYYDLLDRRLELGRAVRVLSVVMSDEEHKRMADQLQQGIDTIEIALDEAPDSEGSYTYYPRYLQGQELARFEEIYGKQKELEAELQESA